MAAVTSKGWTRTTERTAVRHIRVNEPLASPDRAQKNDKHKVLYEQLCDSAT
jgi:hypothetical protein